MRQPRHRRGNHDITKVTMASPRTNQSSRMLGNVRLSSNKARVFPPLSKTISDSNKDHKLRIQGDALTIPASKISEPELVTSPRTVNTKRPLTSRSDPTGRTQDKMKEQQARDKQIQGRIQSLLKVNDQLTAELKSKDEECVNMQTKLVHVEEHYKELYREEKCSHGKTKESLVGVKDELSKKSAYAEQLKTQHERQVVELTAMHEQQFTALKAAKDNEIQEKDGKLEKMKKQIADILKGNSRERQQQLEELTKELNKVSDEASALRLKCKGFMTSKSPPCSNCGTMKAQLEKKTKRLLEREASVHQLNALCGKFEKQLKQQDVLLKEFAESKGFQTNYNIQK